MPTEIRTKVAGVSHDDRQALIKSSLNAASPLSLYREPDNPVDPNAVAVCLFGERLSQIGYLSADRAHTIAPLLDDGWTCRAHVLTLTGGQPGKPTIGVNILIQLQEPQTAVSPTRPLPAKKIILTLAAAALLTAACCLLLLIAAYATQ